MIVYGIRRFGKVDALDEDIHVATQFVHIWFVPLVPLGSYLVLGDDGDGFRGVKIPFSFKSLFAAWMRAGCVLGTACGIALLATGGGGLDDDAIVFRIAGAAWAVLSVVAFVLSYKMFRPSERRKAELRAMLGLPSLDQQLLDQLLSAHAATQNPQAHAPSMPHGPSMPPHAASMPPHAASMPPHAHGPSMPPHAASMPYATSMPHAMRSQLPSDRVAAQEPDGPPKGPVLILAPHVDPSRVVLALSSTAFSAAAAPKGTAGRYWNGTTWITHTLGPVPGLQTLTFEGGDVELAKRWVASTGMPYLTATDVAVLMESNDPHEVRLGLAAAELLRHPLLRPSFERLRMHPDPSLRVQADRLLHQSAGSPFVAAHP